MKNSRRVTLQKINRREFLRRTGATGLGATAFSLSLGSMSEFLYAQDSDTLIMLQGADTSTMDPNAHLERVSNIILTNMYDSLVARAADGSIQPSLSTEWEFEDDLNTVFTLRQGVSFHNGEAFNADDVKVSLDRILFDDDFASPQRSDVSSITNVEVVDEFTVRISTESPFPLLLARLSEVEIVPSGYLAENGDAELNVNAIGTGPYELVEWVRDSQVVMQRNENYWGDPAPVANVVIRAVPEATTRVAELLAGNADVITNMPADQVPAVDGGGDTRVFAAPSNRMIAAYYNPADDESPINNVLVRQALNLAVDQEAIAEFVLEGFGTPIATIFTPFDFGFNPNVEAYPYDPDGARDLLAEAGFPDGFSTTMVSTGQGEFLNDRALAEAIVGFLDDVGVTVELQFREFQSYVDQILNRTIPEEIWVIDFGSGAFDADANASFFVRTDALASYFSFPEADELIDAARATTDPAVREAAYFRMQEIIKENPIAIYSHFQRNLFGLSGRTNWEGRADEQVRVQEMNF